MLRVILAVVAVFLSWSATNIVIHWVLLGRAYADHPALFRPAEGGPDGMKLGLLYLVVFAQAAVFTKIYSWLVALAGIVFGLLWGVGQGVGMGYGTLSTMPIPADMATTWCLGAIVQGVLAGVIVALIIRKRDEPAP